MDEEGTLCGGGGGGRRYFSPRHTLHGVRGRGGGWGARFLGGSGSTNDVPLPLGAVHAHNDATIGGTADRAACTAEAPPPSAAYIH